MSDETNALSGEQDAIVETGQETATPADETAAQADENAETAEQGEQPGDEADDGEAKAEDKDAKADDSDDEDKPKRNRKSASERISQLTQIRRDLERENERLKSRLERTAKLERPDPNKYDDPDEYSSDLAAYKVRKAEADDLQESAKDAETRASQALAEAYNERVMDFAAETPDFYTVAQNPALPISPVMAQEIMDSDVGPQVQYYLGKNPREAAQIAALPPGQQIRAIGRLEARVSAPAPKRVTQAPAPIKPVAGNRTPASFDPNKASVEDYIKKRNEGWAG
jgi:hypothetical protein